MLNRLIFILSLIFLSLTNLSFNWPVKAYSVTSTYGESRWDHFHDGVDLVSADRRVFPFESGRLIFQWNRKLFPVGNYPGAGNFKVIKHTDDIYSIYMHLDDIVIPGNIVTSDLPIGAFGNSGHSFASHLHFTIVDMKKGVSVNPFLKLPPVPDKKKPVIGNLFLEINDRLVQLRNKSSIRLTKHYPLLVNISDSMKGAERLGLYNFKASLNGKEILDIKFSSMDHSTDKIKVSGKDYSALYNDSGYYKIDGIMYTQGLNEILITASDFSGNISEKKFNLIINLDM